jgi:hypothetical protein
MHNFGACVVREGSAGPRELLAMDFGTKEHDRKLRSLAKGHGRCVPGSTIGFGGVLFSGALAEALVERDVPSESLASRLAYDPARAPLVARSVTEEMALCTVLKTPKATAALFETQPATAEETEAMRPIGPVLTECLKKDMKVELNKPGLRSLLALAAYRIVSQRGGVAQ